MLQGCRCRRNAEAAGGADIYAAGNAGTAEDAEADGAAIARRAEMGWGCGVEFPEACRLILGASRNDFMPDWTLQERRAPNLIPSFILQTLGLIVP